jgi:hypothetical protein
MNTKPKTKTHALISSEHLRRLAVVYCRQNGLIEIPAAWSTREVSQTLHVSTAGPIPLSK